MEILSKIEIKLFITFFIIYSLFIHVTGWDEKSRIGLTKAIVSEGRFEIDNYVNITGDRAIYKGHYYTDKAPGTSFLATPIYIISKQIPDYIANQPSEIVFIPQPQLNATIYYLLDLPIEDSMTQIFSVVFLSVLPGALLIVLIYKVSNFFVRDLNLRLLISFLFGLATPLFSNSIVMMGTVLSTLFSFLAFYIILKIIRKKLDQKYLYISGTLLGFSIVIDYLGILIFAGMILLYLLSNLSKKSIAYFLFGSIIGLLPLLIYNFITLSNPLQLTAYYADPSIFTQPIEMGLNLLWRRFTVSLVLALFFPYRGLFFYAPILLLFFYGFHHLYKEDRTLTKVLLFIFFSSLLTIGSHWIGGASFGQRHLTFIIPFLSIPFAASLSKLWKNTNFKIILLILFLISAFYNFIGLEPWECNLCNIFLGPLESRNNINFAELFEGPVPQIFFVEFDLNPLYKHYLPLFLKDGPRSRILEGLLYNPYKIDIRDFKLMPIREIELLTFSSFGSLVLKIPFFVLPILLLIITLIWKEELDKIFILKGVSINSFLIILIIIMFILRLEVRSL